MIQADEFRNVLRHFPSGVTVVTVKAGDEIHGLTVAAFASVSPQPPLILVCLDHRGHGYQLMERSDAVFAVNILRADQQAISDRFAFKEDRFADTRWQTAATGAPILADALAWLDCTIYSRLNTGSNTIYVGQVQASSVVEEGGAPLVYWNRGYRSLAPVSE